MALIFCDSVDHYGTNEITLKYSSATVGTFSNQISVSESGRNGKCLHVKHSSNVLLLTKTLDSFHDTMVFGFAYMTSQLPTNNGNIFALRNDVGTIVGRLMLNANGTVTIFNSSNGNIGTTTYSLTGGAWHYIEFKATVSTGAYELRIDGINRLSGTSTFGANNLGGYSYYSLLVANQTGNYDDIYVVSGDANAPNDFLGDIRVVATRPDSTSSINNDWDFAGAATKHQAVNEESFDGDTSYIFSNTDEAKQSFGFDTVTAPAILGLQIVAGARKDEAGSHAIAPLVRTNNTNFIGTQQSLTNDFIFRTFPYGTNPDTSNAWIATEINNSEFGIELRNL